MSDYHRIYMKLTDLCERGHVVQIERAGAGYEVTVFGPMHSRDHEHTSSDFLSVAMDRAHEKALAAWPAEPSGGHDGA